MQFAITYHRRPNITDEETRRLLQIFMAWTPPHGVELLAHYHFARGGGGIVILKADTASALFEAMTAFDTIIEYEAEPVLNVIDAVAIKMDIDAWVSSLGAKAHNKVRTEKA
jgi:uncharacterized protein DUF3303